MRESEEYKGNRGEGKRGEKKYKKGERVGKLKGSEKSR